MNCLKYLLVAIRTEYLVPVHTNYNKVYELYIYSEDIPSTNQGLNSSMGSSHCNRENQWPGPSQIFF